MKSWRTPTINGASFDKSEATVRLPLPPPLLDRAKRGNGNGYYVYAVAPLPPLLPLSAPLPLNSVAPNLNKYPMNNDKSETHLHAANLSRIVSALMIIEQQQGEDHITDVCEKDQVKDLIERASVIYDEIMEMATFCEFKPTECVKE
jgi:hypothetical protein